MNMTASCSKPALWGSTKSCCWSILTGGRSGIPSLRNYVIDDWQSEPYHEHQNTAERRYQTVKQYTNGILDKSGAPSKAWLLALSYAVYLLNHLATDSLEGSNPLSVLTGLTTDISILLIFNFWEPIYFPTGDALSYAPQTGFSIRSS